MTLKTVDHLASEHQDIEKVLQAFENYMKQLDQRVQSEGPQVVDGHEVWDLLDYLNESLFIRHEEKEEVVLLPELARHGLAWNDGTLAHVRREHRHGRYLMRSVRQAVHQSREWTGADVRHFLSVGHEWVEHLRRHMKLEEDQMFPFLEKELTAEQDANVAGQFEQIDADFADMKDAHKLQQGREEFLDRYRPAP